MKLTSAGVALASALAAVGLAIPAQAADPSGSVDIVTTEATASGPWAQNPPDAPYVSKPTFETHMSVTCPADRRAQLDMSPVWSMTTPGIAFTCTGSRQEVVFGPTSSQTTDEGLTAVTVSATLSLRPTPDELDGPLTQLDADAQQVRVRTVGTGEKPVWPPKPPDPPSQPDPPSAPNPPTPTPAPAAHRPSAPRAVHTRSGARRAMIVWAHPASTGGARIDRYQVRRGTSPARSVPAASRRFTFTRLVNGRTYGLFVRSHNRVGFSRWVRAAARPHAPRPSASPRG